MGSIYSKTTSAGNKFYYCRFKDDHGRWRTKKAGRYRKDAEKLLKRYEREMELGIIDRSETLFSDFSSRWLEQVVSIRVKQSTYDRYASDLRVHLLPYFGAKRLKSIGPEQIQRFIKVKTDSGRSPRTVNTLVKMLGQIMKTAVRWGYLDSNPVDLVDRVKVKDKEMDFLSIDEVDRLLHACAPRAYPLLATAIMSGLRAGELTGLKWCDFDQERGVLFVRRIFHPDYGFQEPKTERGRRSVSISPQLVNILQIHRSNTIYDSSDDLMFPNLLGKPLDHHNFVRREFHPALDRAGMRRVRFHDLRHSYAALMISLGCNIKWLQRQMGHASLTTTMDIYGHILPEVDQDIGARLDSVLFSPNVVALSGRD